MNKLSLFLCYWLFFGLQVLYAETPSSMCLVWDKWNLDFAPLEGQAVVNCNNEVYVFALELVPGNLKEAESNGLYPWYAGALVDCRFIPQGRVYFDLKGVGNRSFISKVKSTNLSDFRDSSSLKEQTQTRIEEGRSHLAKLELELSKLESSVARVKADLITIGKLDRLADAQKKLQELKNEKTSLEKQIEINRTLLGALDYSREPKSYLSREINLKQTLTLQAQKNREIDNLLGITKSLNGAE